MDLFVPMPQGFGRKQKRRATLEARQDPLLALNQLIEWELFRIVWREIEPTPVPGKAGRKPIDRMLLFKMLLIQQLYNISDEQLEYQVHDRLSFRRFLGLALDGEVPDATSVWLFRKQLVEAGLVEGLFEQFNTYLQGQGYQAKGGQIIDATLVPAPKQHNHKDENAAIKQAQVPEHWQQQPHKLAQKDTDARWTKKNGVSHFGYKAHINIDRDYGFIRRYQITDAAVHDSKVFGAIIDGDNLADEIWADSAYRCAALEAALLLLDYNSHIHERGYRNRPLTEAQQQSNRKKSTVRATVEHVFGCWVTSMGGKAVRGVGLTAVRAYLGLKMLTFNLKRYVLWQTKLKHKGQVQCV
jgi:transposase, IS5 family